MTPHDVEGMILAIQARLETEADGAPWLACDPSPIFGCVAPRNGARCPACALRDALEHAAVAAAALTEGTS